MRVMDLRVGAKCSRQSSGAGIEALAADYQADEVMIVTITYDHAARRRSYELIAGSMLS